MDLWLPGYEHQPVKGAGLNVGPGRPKFIGHTTETKRPSLDFLIGHWTKNWGSGLPHFGVEGRRVVQLLPLNVGAYTLENRPGGADTNRSGPAIQAEIVSYAADDWDDDTYESVGKLLADVVTAGVDIDLDSYTRFYGADEGIILAHIGSPIRFSAAEYEAFNGWSDHAHVPENAHWDIGRKDGRRIHSIAITHHGGPPAPPTKDWFDMASEDDLRRVIREENAANRGESPVQLNNSIWTITTDEDGRYVRRWVTGPAELAMLQQTGEVRPGEPVNITPETEVAFVNLPAVPNPGNPF